MKINVEHIQSEQTFKVNVTGDEAELTYSRPEKDLVDFEHTFVPEPMRGQGIAEEMARHALDFARQEKLRVLTSCRFMAGFVKRHHADYADLLA
ncbi:N-acetyltransferase [Hymenobacter sp. BT175]|uniref:GNAT family N-acetyltransferase n=1 Tax=Hymenobacter translucens TaxID=2886507 RepID=UPI001D0DF994|nr:GNAT family N-acetyltransferase [Hymenobacter translucens]MCC2548617.1 N-acetyltransferase [Hymenobacter translucens]